MRRGGSGFGRARGQSVLPVIERKYAYDNQTPESRYVSSDMRCGAVRGCLSVRWSRLEWNWTQPLYRMNSGVSRRRCKLYPKPRTVALGCGLVMM